MFLLIFDLFKGKCTKLKNTFHKLLHNLTYPSQTHHFHKIMLHFQKVTFKMATSSVVVKPWKMYCIDNKHPKIIPIWRGKIICNAHRPVLLFTSIDDSFKHHFVVRIINHLVQTRVQTIAKILPGSLQK